jgi:cyclopropane fatty-acyl-phospholipid synthase-like methyltransferase
MGAAHIDLIEPSPPILNQGQVKILRQMQQNGFRLDPTILREGSEVSLDDSRVTYRDCFMEALNKENSYDYLFSFDVMEHVEDLQGFYAACRKALKLGGQMFHVIDFSGHSEFEDPVPPLDFQTYPDWLFYLMYPPFNRATRSFVSDHQRAMVSVGLKVDETKVTRRADLPYLAALWPRLRRKARLFPQDEVGILEAVVVGHK